MKKSILILLIVLILNIIWMVGYGNATVFLCKPDWNNFPPDMRAASHGSFSLDNAVMNGVPIQMQGIAVQGGLSAVLNECAAGLANVRKSISENEGFIAGNKGSREIVLYGISRNSMCYIFRIEAQDEDLNQLSEESGGQRWSLSSGNKTITAIHFQSIKDADEWLMSRECDLNKDGTISGKECSGRYVTLNNKEIVLIIKK